jgi:hypothetical protein
VIVLDKLIDFLLGLGIEPSEDFQTVVLKDAIINMYIDELGNNRLEVHPVDKMHLATSKQLDDLIDMDFGGGIGFAPSPKDLGFDLDNFKPNNKFHVGDIVVVKGYESQVFKVDAVACQVYLGNNGVEQEYIYALSDTKTGEFYEGYEEDMSIYKNAQLQLTNKLNQEVDKLLDEYNDYIRLFMQFGDSEYRERAEQVMRELKKIQL